MKLDIFRVNDKGKSDKGNYKNFVFAGGGIWGIAYLGMLEYLYKINVIQKLKRVAGVSVGALTACVTSFNIPFKEIMAIENQLDYSKIIGTLAPIGPIPLSECAIEDLTSLGIDVELFYRILTKYGVYSNEYIYEFAKEQIANQFDQSKKLPPYTFADFMNPCIHKNNRPFKELYITATDVSNDTYTVFSYKTTPNVEVAEAIKISSSIPILFEAIKYPETINLNSDVYTDGAVLNEYPINIFDKVTPPSCTLGACFISEAQVPPVNNFLDYINNIIQCNYIAQERYYLNDPKTLKRSIQIYTGTISYEDFNIVQGDPTYNYLYEQGYIAAKKYFSKKC